MNTIFALDFLILTGFELECIFVIFLTEGLSSTPTPSLTSEGDNGTGGIDESVEENHIFHTLVHSSNSHETSSQKHLHTR